MRELIRAHTGITMGRSQKAGWLKPGNLAPALWCLGFVLAVGCAHAPAPSEGEPGVTHRSQVFERLWKVYPNKTDKEGAIEAWNRLQVSDEELKQMRIAYPQWKNSLEWTRDKGANVPPLSKWLGDRMWELEAPPPAPPPPIHAAEVSSFVVQPIYLAPRLAYALSGTVVGAVVYPFNPSAAGKVWNSSLYAPWVWHELFAGEDDEPPTQG